MLQFAQQGELMIAVLLLSQRAHSCAEIFLGMQIDEMNFSNYVSYFPENTCHANAQPRQL